MEAQSTFRRALAEFDRRVEAVTEAKWSAPTPCAAWDVRDLVQHLVYEARWIPPLLDGRTIAEVGDRLEGDLLGEDPKGAWKAAAQEALEAVEDDGRWAPAVHLSYGDRSAPAYLSDVSTDLVIHSWDLARAIGADERLDAVLVEMALANLEPQVDAWRVSGVFGPQVPAPDGSDRQTQLLTLSGRRP